MTERTIKTLAKKLAGEFFEGTRSNRFRGENGRPLMTPAKRLVQREDGQIVEVTVVVPFNEAYPTAKEYIAAHYPYFYSLARQQLTAMLGMPHVHDNIKKAIHAALIEDREKQLKAQAEGKDLPELIGQRNSLGNEMNEIMEQFKRQSGATR